MGPRLRDIDWDGPQENTTNSEKVEKMKKALRQIAGIDEWENSDYGYVDLARSALIGVDDDKIKETLKKLASEYHEKDDEGIVLREAIRRFDELLEIEYMYNDLQ